MFAAGLLWSPLGKEQGAQKGLFGLFSPFRLHSVSTKSAALLAMNCVAFDLLYAVAFFFSSGAVVMLSPIYMNAKQNDTKMKWCCWNETY